MASAELRRASTVHFAAGGEGDVDELKPNFEDDRIQYALVRLGNIQESETQKVTFRDVFITFIGSKVTKLEEGEKLQFLKDAKTYLTPHHSDVIVRNRENFTRETLLAKSNPLSNSHTID